jgi:hypothetical protein
MKPLRVMQCLCLAMLLGSGAEIAYVIHGILVNVEAAAAHLDAVVRHVDEEIATAGMDYGETVRSVHAILQSAQTTADQAELLMIEQRAQLKKTSADSDKSVKALRVVLDRAGLLFKHTDEQLNQQSLPAITIAAQASMKSIGDNAAAIGDSARALTAIMNDPRTGSILANFDSASGHFNVIAGNFETMSNDMKPAVHRLAAPPSKLHSFLDVTYTGLKFGSLFVP